MTYRYAVNERHASYVEFVLRIAERNGVRVAPVLDGDGRVTDQLVVAGLPITVVVPPPPDDWRPQL